MVVFLSRITLYDEFFMVVGLVILGLWIWRLVQAEKYDGAKTRVRATLMVGVPGLLVFGAGIYIHYILQPKVVNDWMATESLYDTYEEIDYTPVLAEIYIVNKSKEEGRVRVGDQWDNVRAGEWEKLEIRTKKDEDTLRAWLGEKVVIDTVITKGTYIGNFSKDISAVAEEVMYGTSYTKKTSDLKYEVLTGPGLLQFSRSVESSLYDFDEEPPASKQMFQYQQYDIDWDLSLVEDGEMLKQIMELLRESKEDEGEESAEEYFERLREEAREKDDTDL
jgi:hypothetical protein